MRTREEQIASLYRGRFVHAAITQDEFRRHILEAEARGIAAIKSSTKTTQEDERPDIRKWQEDQKEWFDPTIREIVAEYAAWRDQQDHSQALKQESLSNEAEQRVRAEIGRDSERLDYLCRNMKGDEARRIVGVISDTGCVDLWRAAIDAAREVG